MRTKLKEGQVIKSIAFQKGNIADNDILMVGNFSDEEIYSKYHNTDTYTKGTPSIDENRGEKEYLVLAVKEFLPQVTIGNRMSSYENTILAIELNPDGTHNENNQKISFSTCYVYSGTIPEEDIHIIREMKKTYI